ncbi:DinB family protein [Paenibacillus thalictri]|uniref:Damage-inducible protein DinB n=1 Tax=Paenibacillus thalictri TaxID=2527873 RepID=A0A4Q9DKP6_9BACL|nr:DinB family protein [Paenibacillus thalictri]TBL71421.1 hypothetical protein EYB31_30505 [Paenibacillus thalictri]
MFSKLSDFEQSWQNEAISTQKVFEGLTDASLNQKVSPEGRTLGEIAWHIVTTLDEMVSRTGLEFEAPRHDSAVPSTAKEIADGYRQGSANLILAINSQWTDATLGELREMYGEQWPIGLTLNVLILHQAHHRGQITVLMRQAGLRVPGVYGPSREEWSEFGMQAPAY